MTRFSLVLSISLLFAAGWLRAAENECSLVNFTGKVYEDELIRLSVAPPGATGTFRVLDGDEEVPYQVETLDGKPTIWVCRTFAAGEEKHFKVVSGKPRATRPRVQLKRESGGYLLDNGLIAVRLPGSIDDPAEGKLPPGPVTALYLSDGRWIGRSGWSPGTLPTKLTTTVIGDGALFAKVRLRYEFGDKRFAECDVMLGPSWQHVELFERHEVDRGTAWEFELTHGWAAKDGTAKTFGGGLGGKHPDADRPLLPVEHQAYRSDMYISLQPRWNQNYADGWAFAATDGPQRAGAVVVRAGRWVWPHDNRLEVIVRPSGDYAGLRCGLHRGQRLWWLVNSATPADPKYVARYAWETLDKLNHEMILRWPGEKGVFTGINYFDNLNINPTSMMRGWNRKAIQDVGKPGNYATLVKQQTVIQNDGYGSYWDHWSPQNPNFFTDYYTRGIVLVSNLKAHPQYPELRRQAIARLKEDVYHSVAMPSGAGQECPGYMFISHWKQMAEICKEHLDMDEPMIWQRIVAAENFRRRISQPDGEVRRRLPIGDTHNSKTDGGPVIEQVPADEVAKFSTVELPGFGVIFNHRAGTPRETYLSFKAGPNRGHYHGDQLAFHYCANAKPLAVDHHCSYAPRAGQEHMHNRVAFYTDKFKYANMGGFERLIAFKTSKEVDIAVGQVESNILRETKAYPPEKWWPRFPIIEYKEPIVYRRTVIFVKAEPQDYFVFWDQYWAPKDVKAVYCLHALDDQTVAEKAKQGATTDGSDLFRWPQADVPRPEGLERGRLLLYRKGSDHPEAYDITAVEKDGLRLSGKPEAGENLGYAILKDRITLPTPNPNALKLKAGSVYLYAIGPYENVYSHPWWHENGGLEQTQGVRLPYYGRVGAILTVMSPTPLAVEGAPGFVGVGGDSGDAIQFGEADKSPKADAVYVTVKRGRKTLIELTGKDFDFDRPQGEIGLLAPDAVAPHGDIPEWLLKQRANPPAWRRW